MKTIEVRCSEEDLHELLNGKVFHWQYDNVNIKLFMGEE